jgi:transcriptional regulator with XRE-family HTH domain
MPPSDRFADNLQRLAGLHGLTMKRAAALADVSESVVSKWASGDRHPSFTSALKFAVIFDVPADRLARADFGELLENELADAEKFRRVEKTLEELSRKFEGQDETVTPIGTKRSRKGRGGGSAAEFAKGRKKQK